MTAVTMPRALKRHASGGVKIEEDERNVNRNEREEAQPHSQPHRQRPHPQAATHATAASTSAQSSSATSSSASSSRIRVKIEPGLQDGSPSHTPATPPARSRPVKRRRSTAHHEEDDSAAAAAAGGIASAAASSASAIAAPVPHSPAPRRLHLSHRPLLSASPRSNLVSNLLSRSLSMQSSRALQAHVIDDALKQLTLAQDKEVKSAHKHNVNDLDIDATEMRYLLSAGGDGLVAVYDTADELNKRGFTARSIHPDKGRGHRYAVSSVQWYPFDTGMFVTSGMEGRVAVWDTNSFQVAHTFNMQTPVHAARMSPVATTHALIATGTTSPNVRLCDMNSGAYSHTLLGHTAEVISVEWSPTHEYTLVTGGSDRTLRVWDIRRAGTMMLLDMFNQSSPFINTKYINALDARARRDVVAHDGPIHCIRWTPDGSQIVSSGADRKLRLWDAQTGKNMLVNYPGVTVVHRLNRFCLSSNGRYIFFPNHLSLYQYTLNTGRLYAKLNAHMDRVTCCTTNPTSNDVFSAGCDRHILVWSKKPQDRQVEEEEEEAEARETRRREQEAQDIMDRAQMEVMRRPPPSSAAGSVAQALPPPRRLPVADEDAWSDDD